MSNFHHRLEVAGEVTAEGITEVLTEITVAVAASNNNQRESLGSYKETPMRN